MRTGLWMAATFVWLPLVSMAAPVNGNFEVGTLDGWSQAGRTSVESALFGINPALGSFQALLLTADEGSAGDAILLSSFLSVPASNLEGYFGGSAIKQTFSATAGQRLLFSWRFLDGEFLNSDLAFVTLNGVVTELASSATQISPSITNTVVGTFGSTGYMSGGFLFPVTGEYTVGFAIVNGSDDSVQSGLLIDDVRLADAISMPEPSTASVCAVGSAAFAVLAANRTRLYKKSCARGVIAGTEASSPDS